MPFLVSLNGLFGVRFEITHKEYNVYDDGCSFWQKRPLR